MSFDTTFDYTAALTAIDGIISGINNEIVNNTATINLCASLSEYQVDFNVCCHSDACNVTNMQLASVQTYLQSLSVDITAVTNLGATEKNKLYDFYVAHPITKSVFMAKLVYNSAQMLTDIDIILGATLSNDQSTFLVNLLYNKYSAYNYSFLWNSNMPINCRDEYASLITAGFV